MFSPPKQSLLDSQTLQRLDSSEVKNINLSQDDLNQTSLPPSPSKQTPYLLHKPYDNNAPPKRFLCFKRRNPNWKDMPNREIIPLLVDQTIPSNQIQTSKYTWLTFLPINLVEQFSQLANFYFLLITVMQTIPAISITSGNPVMAMPLTVILTISAIKALFEDWKRHKSDNEENGRDVLIYRKDKFVKAKWSDIRVGDVIQVNKNEPLPADIILLYSKDHKGRCYVETKNLDGETNLKAKMAHKDISKHFANNENINDTSSFCSFHYDNPTPYLYQFKGTATVGEAKISLDYNNFLLRGCTLKTTEYVYGLVTYTGHETKIMLNSVKAKPKHPRVEQLLSKMVILIFIAQLVVCLFSSLYNTILLNKDLPELGYLELTESKDSFIINVITRMGNWILIFTNFVPISMIVTLEIVRFIQSYQVAFDSKMITDDIWPVVQSSNLNEELGQIEYIFSDKTGTLTSNQMVFRTLSVNGNVYGDGGPRQDTDEPKKPVTDKDLANVDFEDSDFFKILANPSNREFKHIDRMLMAQAICHTVIVEHEGTTTSFSASSPDELALVSFAKLCKYEYKGTNEHNTMTIKTPQKEHKFHILHIFEFNSDRKRMSVVCKDEDGQVILFCKGADSVIFDRLSNSTSEQTIQETNEDLTSFGNSGLRTLLYSMKKLNAKDYHQWMGRYHTAQTSMVDREKQVEALQDELERDLELLGATGIEDLLQDKVGETIEFVLDANIKLWVLTGDKVETALSIGKSCGLIRSDMKEFMIRANNERDLEELFTKSIETIKCTNEQFKFYIVITGETLLYMTNCSRSKELYEKFRILALEANTVLACRISPKQKQEVVEIVRKANSKAVTLAIGDGANDVNMITAAQVGIGIRGKEGLQAARASDYSIGEFKHLKRLMFVHGREFYRKNTQVILYNFYKNMILVLPQFWYGFFNMFSGESLYDPVLYQFYNLLYASLPIGAYAIFDYQYVDQVFERYPKLYNLGRKNKLFTYMAFAKWVLFGAFQAIFVGLLSFYIIENVGMNEEGTTGGFWLSGCMTLAVVTISVNIKVILMCYSYHFLTVLSIIWSISIFYVTLLVLEQIESSNMFGIIAQCAGSVYYWTGVLIVILLTNGIDVAIGRLNYLTDPKASQITANLQNPGETSVISNSSYRRPSKHRKSTKKNTFLEFSL